MSNYICGISCAYRQPSGYCGITGGYETCQYRLAHQPNTVVGYVPSIKKTNYDSVVSKTPEELAEWIGKVTAGGYGMCAPGHYDCEGKDSCAPCWLEWLKQEDE